MKMTAEQMLDLVKDLVTATLEMVEIEQKVNMVDSGRVTNILSEATEKLRDSFAEADEVMAREPASPEVKAAYNRLRQQSVEALQFDDIVTQILSQCEKRGDAMLLSLYRLYEVIETLEMNDPYVDLVRMRARFRRETMRHKSAVEEFDSVKQTSLQQGDIELFID